MRKILKSAILICLAAIILVVTVSCKKDNGSDPVVVPQAHVHSFEDVAVSKAPTCVADGKQTSTCECGVVKVTVLPATGAHTYESKVCSVCGRKDPTGLTAPLLCGDELSSYVIVYDEAASDYTVRAAEYIAQEALVRANITLPVMSVTEATAVNAHEIVVGETSRQISQKLDAETEGFEFALLADEDHIAIEGDYFIIAAAAYYFVETYIPEAIFDIDVPQTASICTPIVKETENVILLIGDGMGFNQTTLFDAYQDSTLADYSDGENFFYGNLFPYLGQVKTNSLSGITDSAAAATALASGYKTNNGSVGRNGENQDIPNITEFAAEQGKATAVMSTEKQTGATPASFSAHAYHRSNASNIQKSQDALVEKYGTIINCDYDVYTEAEMVNLRSAIIGTLADLSKDADGFFMMYEEAYIDKHCSALDVENAYLAMVRFNQAIALFMEYAFYNPETMVILTADHETGGLHLDENGEFQFVSEDHTSANVPVFAYGAYGEVFNGKTVENIQIAKTIAALFGVKIEGTDPAQYPSLLPVMQIETK